jgi:hypothetical protein
MEMNPLRITMFLIAFFFFVAVTKLIRKGELHEKYAIGWFLLGLGVLISGTFPQIIDRIALYLHVSYPPILPICIGMLIVLIQQLHLFTVTTRSEARLKQLAQEVALMNKLLEERDEEKEKVEAQASGSTPGRPTTT